MLHYFIPIPKTKTLAFGDVFRFTLKGTETEVNVSLCRKKVEDLTNRSFHGIEAIVREDLVSIKAYVNILRRLIDHMNKPNIKELGNNFIKNLKIQWSSGLNLDCKSSNSLSLASIFQKKSRKTVFQSSDIKFELYMILFVYALKLRERAMVLISTDMVESTKAYREAAGVFDYLCKISFPDYSAIDKFPELSSPICSSLKLLCLAEGQAVTANKAKEKGTSASLVAKLHYGVTQFVAEANVSLLSKINTQLSSRFPDYVSTLGALHELKSGKHLAESLESEGELGEAIGVLRRALARAKMTTQFRDDTWKSIFKKERELVTTMMNKYERLNKSMILQRIPLEADLPTLQGDKIVKLIPYIHQKEMNLTLSSCKKSN